MRKLTSDEYKSVILNILIKIDKICRENGFNYTIAFGTLLGAVRHKGFIPWDDDIDIFMPREDYAKIGEYLINHPETGLNYIDISNRNDDIYYPAKVCDVSTVINRESTFVHVDGYGAYIDIFPLDYLPNDERKRKKYMKKALYNERLVQHSAKTPIKGRNIVHSAAVRLANVYAHFYNTQKLLRKMHAEFAKNSLVKTDYVGVPYLYDLHADCFRDRTELEFEGHMFYAPIDYTGVLLSSYGESYMELPPENERKTHYLECFVKEDTDVLQEEKK